MRAINGNREANNSGNQTGAAVAARKKSKAAAKHIKLVEVKLKTEKPATNTKENDGAPTPAQQEALVMKYRMKARKLGRSILRAWHARLDLEEVDSLVDLSLCEAVRRFNPFKGASFMTFMYYHLKGNLVRAVAHAATSHSIPVYNLAEGEDDTHNKADFNNFQFRAMNAAEVSEAIYNPEMTLPDEALWKKELHDCSKIACDKLDKLEQDVINRIFLHEEQIMEIASSLGYSRCHISRVKKRALETLYDELRISLNSDDFGKKPNFDEEEPREVQRRVADRRMVHRRRPRSKKSIEVQEILAEAA